MRGDRDHHPLDLLPVLRAGYRRLASLEEWRKLAFLRIAVLASSILLMLPGAWGHSVTAVEFTHLPAGLAAWQRQSIGIYRVCGPLSKFLYALPAHLAGIRVNYPASLDRDVRARREWEVGRQFQLQNPERYHNIYRWSRLVPIMVTVLGGYLICEWATQLFGPRPGLISLCTWCWAPPILAHGSLVTSDMLSAVMLVLAARCFWTFLIRPGLMTTITAGAMLGLAQATKFTLLILYPCWAVILLGRALQLASVPMVGTFERRTSPARVGVLGLILLMVSVVVLDAAYLFQDAGVRLAQWEPHLSSIAKGTRWLSDSRATAWLTRVPLPIPLEFIRGLDVQLADTERTQAAYLFGQSKPGGWWYWYAAASLIKIPLPVITLFVLSSISVPAMLGEGDPRFWGTFCLIIPAAEVAGVISVTTGTGTNAAFRYLIPSLAPLCVGIGHAWIRGSRTIRLTMIALIVWLAINAVAAIPDHLAWQNELGWAWSRWNGCPALVGDSLDWGQDVVRLAKWITDQPDKRTCTLVCVYGQGAVDPYGLGPPFALAASEAGKCSTYLAVSANILFGYHPDQCMSVGQVRSPLSERQRDRLLSQKPCTRLGSTIWIYHLPRPEPQK